MISRQDAVVRFRYYVISLSIYHSCRYQGGFSEARELLCPCLLYAQPFCSRVSTQDAEFSFRTGYPTSLVRKDGKIKSLWFQGGCRNKDVTCTIRFFMNNWIIVVVTKCCLSIPLRPQLGVTAHYGEVGRHATHHWEAGCQKELNDKTIVSLITEI